MPSNVKPKQQSPSNGVIDVAFAARVPRSPSLMLDESLKVRLPRRVSLACDDADPTVRCAEPQIC